MTGSKATFTASVLTWVALVVLTLLTCGLARLHLGSLAMPLALLFASVQAALILGVYMHAFFETGLVRMCIAAVLIFQCIMVGITMGDYLTRGWLLPSGK